MKKYLIPLLLVITFIPFMVNAETCDTDKITIENITIENKTDNVEELDEAIASGKNINLNLSMSEVGDNIEYKFLVKNESSEDYELDKTSLNLNSDYINYSFETDDNSNIVKGNSSKTVILKVEYKNEVPEDQFENGTYRDNKTMTVQLSNGNTIEVPDTLKNPNTGVQSYILLFIIILIISGSIYVLSKKKKYAKFMILFIGCFVIIPISVYALCNCEINIDSSVAITKTNLFSGSIYRSSQTVFSNGDLINSDYVHCEDVEDTCYYIDENEYNNKWVSIKHDIVNNIIINSYVCKNKVCIKGGINSNFEENTQIFLSINSNSTINDDRIYNSGNHDYIEKSGNVRMGSYCGECRIYEESSSCSGLDTSIC